VPSGRSCTTAADSYSAEPGLARLLAGGPCDRETKGSDYDDWTLGAAVIGVCRVRLFWTDLVRPLGARVGDSGPPRIGAAIIGVCRVRPFWTDLVRPLGRPCWHARVDDQCRHARVRVAAPRCGP
jgi:hypothetical protein